MRPQFTIFGFLVSILILLGSVSVPARPQTYVVKKGDTPFGVAKRFGISVDELFRFNSMGDGGSFTVGTELNIPQKGQAKGDTYKVKAGDSVASVADFYGVSQADLRHLNHMGQHGQLRAGQAIQIPKRLRGSAKGHVIQKGDTLAGIAKKHNVSIRNLKAANKLNDAKSLQPGRTLVIPQEDDAGRYIPQKKEVFVKSGKKVPGGVLHEVQSGQTVWMLARAYQIPQDKIAQRNNMDENAKLFAGKKILIPGARKVVPVRVNGYSVQPIRFVRVWNNESARLKLMSKNGRVSPYARKKLSQLSKPRQKGVRNRRLHNRLIHMLQRVADRYPGQTIEIVSGYRPGEFGRESMHTQARALDFRVRGVPNRELYEFCTGLPNTGCGYYPNSVFIHMDVRDKSATWTDYSRPGEKADYRNPESDEDE